MRFLGRVVIVLFGLLLAVATGLLALVAGVAVEPAAKDLLSALGLVGLHAVYSEIWRGGAPDNVAADLLVGAWAISTVILVMPPTLVALLGEAIGTRAFVWYGFGCGALTAALPWLSRGSGALRDGHPALGAEGRLTTLLFLAGAAAGLMYWLVAGRSAGRQEPSPL